MMPTVASSTNLAAASLAKALRARNDVRVRDPDLAAWIVMSPTMGCVLALIWGANPSVDREVVRDELVKQHCRYLRGNGTD